MNRFFKRGLACTMAVAVAFSGIVIAEKRADRVQAAADEYKLVWSDEFNGAQLDRTVWNVEVNADGGGNNELQYYVDSTNNISVSDGTLKIKALRQNYGGRQYTSGRINTRRKAQFKYGRIEAKMKLPSFSGSWPAFWMLGANYSSVGWPKCGEIDIMEAINTENYTNGAVHWNVESDTYNGVGDAGTDAKNSVSAGYQRTDEHIYAIEWNESEIRWYVDDSLFYTQDISANHMEEFRAEQFIIFNLAIGGKWPGYTIDNSAFPATMEVDYVRVYQKQSDNGSMSGTAIPEEPTVEVPTRVETVDVLESKGVWESYYDYDNVWAYSNGTMACADSKGFTMNISSVGTQQWGIQASIKDLDFIRGRTYTYSFDIISSINKNIVVKVVGDDSEDDIFSMENVSLQAGVPYHYEKEIIIPGNYKGKLDLFFAFGGGVAGESINQNTSCVIAMSNAKFVGDISIQLEVPTIKEPVTEATTTQNPNVQETTGEKITQNTTTKVAKPAQAVIKKIVRTKNNKKAKITLKKIQGATKYQIKYSRSRKFLKKTTRTITTKSVRKTIRLRSTRTKYYMKARAIKIVNGKRYYGKWSKRKTIKVNKK